MPRNRPKGPKPSPKRKNARRIAARDEFVPMLTADGIVWINPIGHDRSLVGKYWSEVKDRLENQSALPLTDFDDKSVFDTESDQRLPFITDLDTILTYHEHFDFGPSFYKSRGEILRSKP